MGVWTAKEIRDSRMKALEEIKKFLDVEDVEEQFKDRSGRYYSADKFIVTWNSNYRGMAAQSGIDKTDDFYSSMSRYKAIKVTRGLFHEKQLKGYASIERALIEVGMELSPKGEKKAFYDKYATKYNERLKEKLKENESRESGESSTTESEKGQAGASPE